MWSRELEWNIPNVVLQPHLALLTSGLSVPFFSLWRCLIKLTGAGKESQLRRQQKRWAPSNIFPVHCEVWNHGINIYEGYPIAEGGGGKGAAYVEFGIQLSLGRMTTLYTSRTNSWEKVYSPVPYGETAVPEFIYPVFAKTSPKLGIYINSGTGLGLRRGLSSRSY